MCHNFLTTHLGQVVTVYNLSTLFCQAWQTSMTIFNVVSGFKVTGIYPFNRDVLLNPIRESFSEPPPALG